MNNSKNNYHIKNGKEPFAFSIFMLDMLIRISPFALLYLVTQFLIKTAPFVAMLFALSACTSNQPTKAAVKTPTLSEQISELNSKAIASASVLNSALENPHFKGFVNSCWMDLERNIEGKSIKDEVFVNRRKCEVDWFERNKSTIDFQSASAAFETIHEIIDRIGTLSSLSSASALDIQNMKNIYKNVDDNLGSIYASKYDWVSRKPWEKPKYDTGLSGFAIQPKITIINRYLALALLESQITEQNLSYKAKAIATELEQLQENADRYSGDLEWAMHWLVAAYAQSNFVNDYSFASETAFMEQVGRTMGLNNYKWPERFVSSVLDPHVIISNCGSNYNYSKTHYTTDGHKSNKNILDCAKSGDFLRDPDLVLETLVEYLRTMYKSNSDSPSDKMLYAAYFMLKNEKIKPASVWSVDYMVNSETENYLFSDDKMYCPEIEQRFFSEVDLKKYQFAAIDATLKSRAKPKTVTTTDVMGPRGNVETAKLAAEDINANKQNKFEIVQNKALAIADYNQKTYMVKKNLNGNYVGATCFLKPDIKWTEAHESAEIAVRQQIKEMRKLAGSCEYAVSEFYSLNEQEAKTMCVSMRDLAMEDFATANWANSSYAMVDNKQISLKIDEDEMFSGLTGDDMDLAYQSFEKNAIEGYVSGAFTFIREPAQSWRGDKFKTVLASGKLGTTQPILTKEARKRGSLSHNPYDYETFDVVIEHPLRELSVYTHGRHFSSLLRDALTIQNMYY